jgi:hypothetical protein
VSSKYDPSRVGTARRQAIQALDDYGCAIAEQCSMFGITEPTFHRNSRLLDAEHASFRFDVGTRLATIWQQCWPCHPNASTMAKRHSRDVFS